VLTAVRVFSSEGEAASIFYSDCDLYVELDFVVRGKNMGLCVGFDLTNSEGVTVFRTYQTDLPQERWPTIHSGRNRLRCKISKGLLNSGDFIVNPRISIHNVAWIVYENTVLQFRIILGHGVSSVWPGRPGLIAPILEWKSIGI
jgi:hypothetical protein